MNFLRENIIFVLSSLAVIGLIAISSGVKKPDSLNLGTIQQTPVVNTVDANQASVQTPVEPSAVSAPTENTPSIKNTIPSPVIFSATHTQVRKGGDDEDGGFFGRDD